MRNVSSCYKLVHDDRIAAQVRDRFSDQIEALETEGFREFSLHQEAHFPFSLLAFFPIYLAMVAGKEVLKIQWPLRLTSFHLLYASKAHATYAYVYGLGPKFYTQFTDDTWLVTNSGVDVKDETIVNLRREEQLELMDTAHLWQTHHDKLEVLEAEGRRPNSALSFDAWVGVETRFDQAGWSGMIGIAVIWLGIVGVVLVLLVKYVLVPLVGGG